MLIQTTRFGEIEIEQDEIVTFVIGILGFEEMNQFILLKQPESPFEFLQSTIDSDLAFVVADPFTFFEGYEFELKDSIKTKLGIHSEKDVSIKVIISVRSESEVTANLRAPIVINQSENKAAQLVLDRPDYQTRHSIIKGGREDADLIQK